MDRSIANLSGAVAGPRSPPVRDLRHDLPSRDLRRRQVSAQAARLTNPEEATSQIPVTSDRPDVSNATVQTTFRFTPHEAEKAEAADNRTHANILFVGESNTSRSILAHGIFTAMVAEAGLSDSLQCESKGTRDYNIGQGPEQSVRDAAASMGINLPDVRARQFVPEKDIVVFDMVVVMDKYTAADVLKEVSVFDTISKDAQYTKRVRRLGEFHPELGPSKVTDGQDIDDPLYGNVGGSEEQETVRQTAVIIKESCQGLLQWLSQLQDSASAPNMRQAVQQAVLELEATKWLTPPMLEKM